MLKESLANAARHAGIERPRPASENVNTVSAIHRRAVSADRNNAIMTKRSTNNRTKETAGPSSAKNASLGMTTKRKRQSQKKKLVARRRPVGFALGFCTVLNAVIPSEAA